MEDGREWSRMMETYAKQPYVLSLIKSLFIHYHVTGLSYCSQIDFHFSTATIVNVCMHPKFHPKEKGDY